MDVLLGGVGCGTHPVAARHPSRGDLLRAGRLGVLGLLRGIAGTDPLWRGGRSAAEVGVGLQPRQLSQCLVPAHIEAT